MKEYIQYLTYIYSNYGTPTAIVIGLLFILLFVYISWSKVVKFPGIERAIKYLSLDPTPNSDPNRFSILVAHLEHDVSRKHELLIIEALKEFDGIQVLCLDRTISLAGPVPEEIEEMGQKTAISFLERSGASVLIWGTVIRHGNSSIPKLFWTSIQGANKPPKRYDTPSDNSHLCLPIVFWTDLIDIVRLLVVSEWAEIHEERHYPTEELPRFIKRVRTLTETSIGQPGWDSEGIATTRLILAKALRVFGKECGENEPLEEAIALCLKALENYSRQQNPLQWAKTQLSLGRSYSALGWRQSSTVLLEKAVCVYKESLKELTRELAPLEWAKTQNMLGLTLSSLGERKRSSALLEEAIYAYNEALQEATRESSPLFWSAVQNNLGTALGQLGRMKEAVAAFRESLKECSRKREPLEWASTQTNIGTALTDIGNKERAPAVIEEALIALRKSLDVCTREHVPQQWAQIQSSLGIALCSLAELNSTLTLLEEGVGAFRKALQEFTSEHTPFQWAKTQYNLGNSLVTLGESECLTAAANEVDVGWGRGTVRLEEAVTAYRAALEVITTEHYPELAGDIENNLNLALDSLGNLQSKK